MSRAVLFFLNMRFLCSGVSDDVMDSAFISWASFLFWEALSFCLAVEIGELDGVDKDGGVGVEAARRREDAIGSDLD